MGIPYLENGLCIKRRPCNSLQPCHRHSSAWLDDFPLCFVDLGVYMYIYIYIYMMLRCRQFVYQWAASVPFYYPSLTVFQAWISNYIYRKMWDEVPYPSIVKCGMKFLIHAQISRLHPTLKWRYNYLYMIGLNINQSNHVRNRGLRPLLSTEITLTNNKIRARKLIQIIYTCLNFNGCLINYGWAITPHIKHRYWLVVP